MATMRLPVIRGTIERRMLVNYRVDPAIVRTNIVCARREVLPDRFIERLAAAGVRCGSIDPRTVRFVTHKDVDDDAITRTIAALDELRGA